MTKTFFSIFEWEMGVFAQTPVSVQNKKTPIMESIRIVISLGLMYLTSQILIVLYNYIQCLVKSEKIKIEKREKYFGLTFIITIIIGLLYWVSLKTWGAKISCI
jgi:hypothetical protein